MNKRLLSSLTAMIFLGISGPSHAGASSPAEIRQTEVTAAKRITAVGWLTSRAKAASGEIGALRALVRSGGQPVRRVVKLKRKVAKGNWRTVQRKRTRPDGTVRVRLGTVRKVTKYRMWVRPTDRYRGRASRVLLVANSTSPSGENPYLPTTPTTPDNATDSSPDTERPNTPGIPGSAQPTSPSDRTAVCDSSAKHSILGRLDSGHLDEVSGVAASGRSSQRFWVHNDSGDSPSLYAISSSGALEQTTRIAGVTARDWEDIAFGPGPETGQPYLYIGDIGDNPRVRSSVTVHRLLEPALGLGSLTTADVDSIVLTYPDGPHNAETLLIDPWDGSLLIVTKTSAGVAQLYSTDYFGPGSHSRSLVHRGSVEVTETATAGDVSRDGSSVLIRGYSGLYGWQRTGNEPLWSALSRQACVMGSVNEVQGEAVGFLADDSGYLTISEKIDQPLNQFLFQ